MTHTDMTNNHNGQREQSPHLTLSDIQQAAARLAGHIHHTPLLTSQWLNSLLGHQFYFKAENQQKTGAFKARGAYNSLAWLKENHQLPRHVVAYSSGNHAQAVAWAGAQFGIRVTILMPKNVSKVKAAATQTYGATVNFYPDRPSAEAAASDFVNDGAFLLPPYDHDQVICGQGTAVYEALQQQADINAVFTPCGGGGLLSGSVIAAKGLQPQIKVFGAEPIIANDAAQSLSNGQIIRFDQSPNTIADGVRTLAVSPRTFQYLQTTDGIIEIAEAEIIYWTQWLTHLLKVTIEPTSALGMAAACRYLSQRQKSAPKNSEKLLIVLSGGNMDHATRTQVWQQDHINTLPSLMV